MKKIISIILSLLFVLNLLGCKKIETNTQNETVLTVSTNSSATFNYKGKVCKATLSEVKGNTAKIVFESDSQEVETLTKNIWQEVDLDKDGLTDIRAKITSLSQNEVKFTVNDINSIKGIEVISEEIGGVAPYGTNHQFLDRALIPIENNKILLLYTNGFFPWILWEKYDLSGKQVNNPGFGGGKLYWKRLIPNPSDDVEVFDAVKVGENIVVAFENNKDIYLSVYNKDLIPIGHPTFAWKGKDSTFLATDGANKIWLTGVFPPEALISNNGQRVGILEFTATSTPILRNFIYITKSVEGFRQAPLDIAFDEASNSILLVYAVYNSSKVDYHLASIGKDGKLKFDIKFINQAKFGSILDTSLTSHNGKALVFTFSEDWFENLFVFSLDSGSYNLTWRKKWNEGIADFPLDNYCFEFANIKGVPYLVFLGDKAEKFILQPFNENGQYGNQIVLNGGQPVNADILIEENSLKANPKKAVCGSPCLIQGSIYNRGGKVANKVTATFLADGNSIGSLEIGNINPFESVTFAKIYDVPSTLEKTSVNIEIKLSTTSTQFSTKNDSAQFSLEVLQKGVIWGRVSDGSGIEDPTWWTRGLEGVKVTYKGIVTYTDKDGMYTIENVDFGKGTVTFEKEGFNSVSMDVETTRTKPIVIAGARMNNHGRLKLIVQDENGNKLQNVSVYLVDYEFMGQTDNDGTILFNIPKGTYRIAFRKTGYQTIPPTNFLVELGKEKLQTITMKEATTAFLNGKVVDKKSSGVAQATIKIENYKQEVVWSGLTNSEGEFGPLELTVKPNGFYKITASKGDLTVTESLTLIGGETYSRMIELIPGRGQLAERSITNGFTSWMIKAGWPGFMDLSGTTIYVWYGNYAIQVSATYWDKSRELDSVTVTTWGGTYETHVTKGEIEFKVKGEDLTGAKEKKLPPAMGQKSDANLSWWKKTGKAIYQFYEENKGGFDLAKEIVKGVKKVKDAWSSDDEWIVLGQGAEVLTWKQSLEDFIKFPDWDWSHPLDSAKSWAKSIPTSFAIPIVIGGHSVENTAVRVDGIDVMNYKTGEVYYSNRSVWYNFSDPDNENATSRTFEMNRYDIPVEDIRVFVWLKVQKERYGDLIGTCFSDREQQAIIFDPDRGAMKAFIAYGEYYLNPTLWTDNFIRNISD